MSISFQRLIIILFSLILLTGAALLILYNSKQNLVFFYTPTEFLVSEKEDGQKVRIGGFVKKNSVLKEKSNLYEFEVTDNNNSILIKYKGILPNLFREEQGVVIEGKIKDNNTIDASRVFAKHDENYMPASIQKELKNKNYWQKEYISDLNEFKIESLFDREKLIFSNEIKEEFIIINFFASWCAPCKLEHPIFFDIKEKFSGVHLLGISFKDKKNDTIKYLNDLGNPYDSVGIDNNGSLGLELGVFGLPETIIVNKQKKIIYKHLGPLNKKMVNEEIRPLFE